MLLRFLKVKTLLNNAFNIFPIMEIMILKTLFNIVEDRFKKIVEL